jgi:hypothetical protein
MEKAEHEQLQSACERLYQVVLELATSRQPLPARLTDAYNLYISILFPDELPVGILRDQFTAIVQRMEQATGATDAAASAPVARLSTEAARAIISQIVSLYDAAVRYLPPVE